VATVYDAYILEREGQIFEQIYGEYYQLNISSAPRITSVFSVEDAIEEIKTGRFDLVIVVTGIDNMPLELSRRFRELNPELPILLLINNNNQISHMPG
jgi:DNA-binding response OmpR family regulator